MLSDVELLSRGVWLVISLIALMVTIRFVVLPTFMTEFRQRIFTLRRELFLYMADGHIAPEHPAYVMLRNNMNGLLRFTEDISFGRMILGALFFRQPSKMYALRFERCANLIEGDEVRNHLTGFKTRIGKEILVHSFKVSPSAWVFGVLIASVVLLIVCVASVVKGAKWCAKKAGRLQLRAISSIEAQASELLDQAPMTQRLATADTTICR
jgi:hypothetical protein